MRTTRLCLAFAAALASVIGLADSPPVADGAFDADAWEARHARSERELFDLLRVDGSPRVQVLAGRIVLSDEDAKNPLQPKGDDIVARAANLAPDDAFVQAVAASEGHYFASQCGPVRWPEAEVANLVRLEPDNAAAWRYAVALAAAKGDQAGIDAALERMATAARAYDHEGEEVAIWTRVFRQHPATLSTPVDDEPDAGPPRTALAAALERVTWRYSGADAAFKRACQPDGSTEQDWRRLDWCERAGQVLASEGESFALRELGLSLLDKRDGHADLQREYDWLEANASNPALSMSAYSDAPEDRERDWMDAEGSVVAAQRRLARLGKPATPPEGWVAEEAYDAAEAEATADAWLTYLRTVFDAMRASGDAREQVLAVIASRALELQASPTADEKGADEKTANRTIAAIATTRPDELLVQAAVAQHGDADARAAALARLQRLDPDNAATWALSLPSADDAADPAPMLKRMAASRHHDDYLTGFVGIWEGAFARVPLPQDLAAAYEAMVPDFDGANMSKVAAMGSMSHLHMGNGLVNLSRACGPDRAMPGTERREACTGAARVILHQGRTVLAARFGEALLRKLEALSDADAERARLLAWWQQAQSPAMQSGDALEAYFEDWQSTGSEVEALRLAATRADKAEPPADWHPSTNARAPEAPL
jgi:hypothetical protein